MSVARFNFSHGSHEYHQVTWFLTFSSGGSLATSLLRLGEGGEEEREKERRERREERERAKLDERTKSAALAFPLERERQKQREREPSRTSQARPRPQKSPQTSNPQETLDTLRIACKNTRIMCAVMLDTKGPEIRTGFLENEEPIKLVAGDEVTITTDYERKGRPGLIAMSYKKLAQDVAPGSQILCADGSIVLEVVSTDVEAGTVQARCLNNATLGEVGSCVPPSHFPLRSAPPSLARSRSKSLALSLPTPPFSFSPAQKCQPPRSRRRPPHPHREGRGRPPRLGHPQQHRLCRGLVRAQGRRPRPHPQGFGPEGSRDQDHLEGGEPGGPAEL